MTVAIRGAQPIASKRYGFCLFRVWLDGRQEVAPGPAAFEDAPQRHTVSLAARFAARVTCAKPAKAGPPRMAAVWPLRRREQEIIIIGVGMRVCFNLFL
jgi:hypothetical protein